MIFLYETDKATAEVLCLMFNELGHGVLTASKEKEAVEFLKTEQFEYLFIDCWEETHQTCRAIVSEISKIRRELRPHIVIMKQTPFQEHLHDILETYQVLIKPFDMETLEYVIRS